MARKGNNLKPSFFGKIKEKIKEGFERIFKPKEQKQTKEPEQTETKPKHVLPPEPRKPVKQKQTPQQTPKPQQPPQPKQTVQPTRQSTPTPEQIKARANEERKKYTPATPTPRQDNINKDKNLWTNTVINNFRNNLENLPDKAREMIGSWLSKMIADHGNNAVAQMLQDGAEAGLVISLEMLYKTDKLQSYLSQMMEYLPEMTDWYKAEILDSIDSDFWDEVD